MIGILLGTLAGAVGGYATGRVRKGRKDKAAERLALESRAAILPPANRPPQPNAVIPLPQDTEDFEVLTDAVIDCLAVLMQRGVPVTKAALRDCILDSIYPDFPWPPVPGDAPSAGLMFLIADHESGKALGKSAGGTDGA